MMVIPDGMAESIAQDLDSPYAIIIYKNKGEMTCSFWTSDPDMETMLIDLALQIAPRIELGEEEL